MKILTLSTRDLLALYQAIDRTLRCDGPVGAGAEGLAGPLASDWHWYTAQIEAELDERGVDYELASAVPGATPLPPRAPHVRFDEPDDWSHCEPPSQCDPSRVCPLPF